MNSGAEHAVNAGSHRHNLYISALMFGGLPSVLFDLMLAKSFETVISPVLLDELEEKLCGKFELSRDDAFSIRTKITGVATVIEPSETLHVIERDPDDDRVLECAVSGKADVIISGDRDLLDLHNYQGMPIMRVREFLNSIDKNN